MNAPRSQKTSQNSARPALRDRRNPPPYEEIYVRIGSAAKFGRDDVRPEKCDGDIERLIPAEVLQDSQDFEFSLPVKAIAALGFESRRPVGGELGEIRQGAMLQQLRRRLAQPCDRRADAAASRAISSYVAPELRRSYSRRAARRENEMRVRVDESGKNHAAAEVQFLRPASLGEPLDPTPRADIGDAALVDQ